MMIHPVGGMGEGPGTAGIVPTLAINTVNVEFFGKTAHAGGAPWDGVNALDAVNIAYSSISAMRQQLHTTDRVHGIITKGGDAPNSESGVGEAAAGGREVHGWTDSGIPLPIPVSSPHCPTFSPTSVHHPPKWGKPSQPCSLRSARPPC